MFCLIFLCLAQETGCIRARYHNYFFVSVMIIQDNQIYFSFVINGYAITMIIVMITTVIQVKLALITAIIILMTTMIVIIIIITITNIIIIIIRTITTNQLSSYYGCISYIIRIVITINIAITAAPLLLILLLALAWISLSSLH